MSKKTHTRQDAKKQYLLTFATFKHAVPQPLQKLKGNVNSLDISACTSLERERRWLHWQSSTHTQPATALQRENICHKYRDITTLLTALDWPIILKTRRPIRKRRARHPRHYWSVHWDWHPGEQFIELNHAVCLQDWGDTEGTGVCELLEFCQTKHRKTDMHTFQKIWANLQTLQSCIPNNSALLWLKNKRLCSL